MTSVMICLPKSYKPRKNHKTLPREHHISCQMCKVALFKSTAKINKNKKVLNEKRFFGEIVFEKKK